jgi:integrase
MGRPRKPYFRESDGWWVSRFHGEYVKLARGQESEAEAKARFHELMAEEALAAPVESRNVTVAALFEAFLDWSHRHNSSATYTFYKGYLQRFVDLHGNVLVRELKRFHVTHWLDASPERGEGGQRAALTALKRAFNWAVDEEHIKANPIKKYPKPPAQRRERVLTAQEQETIAGAPRDQAFRDFVLALRESGCRPGEIASVTAAQVDLDRAQWVLPRHKTVKKTRRPRVVVLTEPLIALCRELVTRHPEGPIFRNSRGQPWSKEAIRCRFKRLRRKCKLGDGVVAYSFRHSFCTAGLEAGVPAATMAELLGHTSLEMVARALSRLV